MPLNKTEVHLESGSVNHKSYNGHGQFLFKYSNSRKSVRLLLFLVSLCKKDHAGALLCPTPYLNA